MNTASTKTETSRAVICGVFSPQDEVLLIRHSKKTHQRAIEDGCSSYYWQFPAGLVSKKRDISAETVDWLTTELDLIPQVSGEQKPRFIQLAPNFVHWAGVVELGYDPDISLDGYQWCKFSNLNPKILEPFSRFTHKFMHQLT